MNNNNIIKFNILNIIKKFIYLILVISLPFVFSNNVFASSASFYTSGGGSVYTNQTVNLIVSVNGSDAFNAVSVNVSFSNLILLGSSPTSGWTTVSGPSNSSSSISYSGANLGGQYVGSKSVLSLSFKTLGSASRGTVSSSGSIALANGSGTQVSGSGNTAVFSVTTPPPAPLPVPNAVSISSSSHPDQSTWYKTKDAVISWNKQDGITDFSYVLDQTNNTTPPDTSNGSDISKTFQNLPDGINYFHIKAKNSAGWGAVSQYIINVDTQNPEPFSITKIINPSNSQEYIIYFSTNDSPSGINKYTMQLDGVDKGEQKSGVHIPITSNSITITAIDKAQNSTNSLLQLNSNDQNNKTSTTRTIESTSSTNSNSTSSQSDTSSTPKSNNALTIILVILSTALLIYSLLITFLYVTGISIKDIKNRFFKKTKV